MYAYMLVDNNRMYWTNGDYSIVLVHTHAINIVSVFFSSVNTIYSYQSACNERKFHLVLTVFLSRCI